MSEEIVHIPSEHIQLGTLLVEPERVVERAAKIATALAKVINDQRLYKVINDRKYVYVDGWNTLGAMIGVLPREEKCEKYFNVLEEHIGFEAYVGLYRVNDGMRIGGASSICTWEEKNWSDRDEYALRSMAITRATGKAFRMDFSWIMKLAGYEGTPYEEMPETPSGRPPEKPPLPEDEQEPLGMYTPTGWGEGHFIAAVGVLIEAEIVPPDTHPKHYANFIKKSGYGPDVSYDDLIGWGKLYRGHRDGGLSADDAAKKASEDWGQGR